MENWFWMWHPRSSTQMVVYLLHLGFLVAVSTLHMLYSLTLASSTITFPTSALGLHFPPLTHWDCPTVDWTSVSPLATQTLASSHIFLPLAHTGRLLTPIQSFEIFPSLLGTLLNWDSDFRSYFFLKNMVLWLLSGPNLKPSSLTK